MALIIIQVSCMWPVTLCISTQAGTQIQNEIDLLKHIDDEKMYIHYIHLESRVSDCVRYKMNAKYMCFAVFDFTWILTFNTLYDMNMANNLNIYPFIYYCCVLCRTCNCIRVIVRNTSVANVLHKSDNFLLWSLKREMSSICVIQMFNHDHNRHNSMQIDNQYCTQMIMNPQIGTIHVWHAHNPYG